MFASKVSRSAGFITADLRPQASPALSECEMRAEIPPPIWRLRFIINLKHAPHWAILVQHILSTPRPPPLAIPVHHRYILNTPPHWAIRVHHIIIYLKPAQLLRRFRLILHLKHARRFRFIKNLKHAPSSGDSGSSDIKHAPSFGDSGSSYIICLKPSPLAQLLNPPPTFHGLATRATRGSRHCSNFKKRAGG